MIEVRCESAVRDAHQVDVAVAPGLRGQPFDRIEAVELLLRDVLVDRPTLRAAGSADVYPRDRVAVTRQLEVVAHDPGIHLVLAVRGVIHDDRHRALRVARGQRLVWVGHVEVGGEADAVAHRDPDVAQEPDAVAGTQDPHRRTRACR
jgi:hypothetical protein